MSKLDHGSEGCLGVSPESMYYFRDCVRLRAADGPAANYHQTQTIQRFRTDPNDSPSLRSPPGGPPWAARNAKSVRASTADRVSSRERERRLLS